MYSMLSRRRALTVRPVAESLSLSLSTSTSSSSDFIVSEMSKASDGAETFFDAATCQRCTLCTPMEDLALDLQDKPSGLYFLSSTSIQHAEVSFQRGEEIKGVSFNTQHGVLQQSVDQRIKVMKQGRAIGPFEFMATVLAIIVEVYSEQSHELSMAMHISALGPLSKRAVLEQQLEAEFGCALGLDELQKIYTVSDLLRAMVEALSAPSTPYTMRSETKSVLGL